MRRKNITPTDVLECQLIFSSSLTLHVLDHLKMAFVISVWIIFYTQASSSELFRRNVEEK